MCEKVESNYNFNFCSFNVTKFTGGSKMGFIPAFTERLARCSLKNGNIIEGPFTFPKVLTSRFDFPITLKTPPNLHLQLTIEISLETRLNSSSRKHKIPTSFSVK